MARNKRNARGITLIALAITEINDIEQNNGYWTNNNTIDVGYNAMYSKSSYWWLTSPSSYESNYICFMNGSKAFLSIEDYDKMRGIGPLVSLDTEFLVEIEE